MLHLSKSRRRTVVGVFTTIALVMTLASPVSAKSRHHDFRTDADPYITLAPGVGRGARLQPIITVGDEVNGFMFEGLPDGVGVRPASDDDHHDDDDDDRHGRRDRDDDRDHDDDDAVEVYVAHEQTVVPFFNERDFEAASVSKLTVSTEKRRGGVLDASVALSPDDGFQRFCSAAIAGPEEGLDDYIFFTGEETSEFVDGVQRGFAVVLNTDTGESTAVPGLGRLNHENTIVIPDYDELAMITTDDTFAAGTSQLYMYIVKDQDALFDDEGSLYAFQITHKNGVAVDPYDPFNGANDYLDIGVDDDVEGRFIPVPRHIAVGDQTMLEDWSNDNNVVQFVRLEDAAVDKKNDRIVYIADTGGSRIQPDATTGRMNRDRNGISLADNGRVFKMVMNDDDPTIVDSLTVLADGDAVGHDKFVPFTSPDNLDTSKKSLMVQEDTDGAAIWQMKIRNNRWREVATVNDPEGESSGIVDVSEWFGRGWWMLTVQAHSTNVEEEVREGVTFKREDGQLLLMKIPGS